MKKVTYRIISLLLLLSLLLPCVPAVIAVPSETDIVTTASGYTSAADVVYNIVDGYVTNWGARGEDCTFLTTYANAYYTGDYTYDTLSALDGGTSSTDAPDSALYTALQSMMVANHTTFTKYGGTSALDCKKLYQYTDCMLGDISTVSTLYRGELVAGAWDGGVSYNQEHVWPQSKCIGTASTDKGDIMQLRPANPSENSSRNNTAYGEGEDYYDPGVSVRGDCARTLLYMYVRWGNTANMWGVDGVIENLDILLRWIEEDPVDTWEMGHNDAVQSITGTRNVFVDYPEYAWLLFGSEIPSDFVSPSDTTTATGQTAQLVTDATSLAVGDQIILVASGYDYALSTTQNTGNRGQAAITRNADGSVTFGADTQIITLESGTVDGTFAFQVGNAQYLYAASSSSNYLKITDTPSDNSAWAIQIESGLASITASGTYSRNVMRYNATSSLFSCYSATNSQKDICIYKITPDTEAPEISANTATLVTDASALSAGDQVIIVAADYDFAMSTEQKTNNRGQSAITKSEDGTTITYTADTQIITLEAGAQTGTFGFQVGDAQYLYAASSSANNLKTATSLSDNGSWTIQISSGLAAITANGTYTRNTLRYNSTSGLFSCYAAENTQKDISIYKIPGGSVISPTMTVTGTSLSFEDEIFYNIYYTVDDASSVVEMGLVTFTEKLADGTHENAVDVIPGYVSGGGEYMVHTNGIPAKNMGD
ncbi:MAG: endonuclease, partial [Oscillospiraceae bacterium]|nr:endonuclease [Oscillospiraceae bacterium]